MRSGRADIDQVVLGRSTTNTANSITNAFSLFKLMGGEFVLGSGGFYAGNSWNNGNEGSGYKIKLSGGTLRADKHWSSLLDMQLTDSDGGVVFNTADSSGRGHLVTLNGALYGSGSLKKTGDGTLLLAGPAIYGGKTIVEMGELVVGQSDASDYYRWTADSLSGESNSAVTEWHDVSYGIAAANTTPDRMPSLIRNELNGHSVVRFDSSNSQYLEVSGADRPIGGATAFTIAIVFKTSQAGAGGSANWYQNTGLLDAEQGSIQNDWGLAYNSSGQVALGAGFPADKKDTNVYSGSSYPVHDGLPHIAICAWEGTQLSMNVDGRVTTATSTAPSVSPHNAYRILFGSLNGLANQYFHGDMAEVRIYPNHALSSAEQNQLGMELTSTYGVATPSSRHHLPLPRLSPVNRSPSQLTSKHS